MRDVSAYLAAYEKQMARGDYLHLGTHPPGLILFHRACVNLCTAFPALGDLLQQTEPLSFRDVMDVTATTEHGGRHPITPTDTAAIWLAALLTQALAVATLIPLFLLVNRTDSLTTSWWTAALWPLVPALAIFLPKSDALLPFFGLLYLWLWLEGFRRGNLALCVLSGFAFFVGMCLSLAILPVALAALLLTVWEALVCSRDERVSPLYRAWGLRIAMAARRMGNPRSPCFGCWPASICSQFGNGICEITRRSTTTSREHTGNGCWSIRWKPPSPSAAPGGDRRHHRLSQSRFGWLAQAGDGSVLVPNCDMGPFVAHREEYG